MASLDPSLELSKTSIVFLPKNKKFMSLAFMSSIVICSSFFFLLHPTLRWSIKDNYLNKLLRTIRPDPTEIDDDLTGAVSDFVADEIVSFLAFCTVSFFLGMATFRLSSTSYVKTSTLSLKI